MQNTEVEKTIHISGVSNLCDDNISIVNIDHDYYYRGHLSNHPKILKNNTTNISRNLY